VHFQLVARAARQVQSQLLFKGKMPICCNHAAKQFNHFEQSYLDFAQIFAEIF